MTKNPEIYPVKNPDTSKYGWRAECDFFVVSGFLETELHPDKLSISDNAIAFDYSVGDDTGSRTVTRSFELTKTGGLVSAVTFPNGHTMEVVRK